jgi:hypothetical protein
MRRICYQRLKFGYALGSVFHPSSGIFNPRKNLSIRVRVALYSAADGARDVTHRFLCHLAFSGSLLYAASICPRIQADTF